MSENEKSEMLGAPGAQPVYPNLGSPMMQQYPNQPPAYAPGTQPMLVQQPVYQVNMAAPVSHTSQRMSCPFCQAQIMTRVQYDSGSKTHLIALLICVCAGALGCCLIPYCVDSLKNANHYCPSCGRLIGTHEP